LKLIHNPGKAQQFQSTFRFCSFTSMSIRVVLADDHPLFREGLETLLRREKEMSVVASFNGGKEVTDFLRNNAADVCILDINMPDQDGIATVKDLRSNKINIPVIVLTTYNDIELIRALLNLDVAGYVLKNSTGEELVTAIRKVLQGGKWFSAEVQQAIAEDYVNSERKKSEPEIILTPREVEIVKLLADEHTNDQIAEKLFISFRTVETHRKNIMQKTGAKNLAGLINFAHTNGLLK
jgi:DNA-binding NarL/FixJ family response regulator